jgi:2-keto-4-pentenoate hydratase/2-oxohepta-3-ene-1,7-dioic acid hydratase in catechol pathway
MRTARFRDEGGSVEDGEWTADGIEFGGKQHDPDNVDVLPPVEPTKVVGMGPNHPDNEEQFLQENGPEQFWPDEVEDLLLYAKPLNTIVGHGDTVQLRVKEETDFEMELGVVIGEQCRNVSASEASDVIAGYTCVNDITNFDVPVHEISGIRAQGIDDSTPIGPVVATPDEVPTDAEMELRVDGERRQHAFRDEYMYDEHAVIEVLTRYTTLEPGDVLSMGTPGGSGRVSDGDRIEIEIEGIGTLEHNVEFV